jgi:hypothetical protein
MVGLTPHSTGKLGFLALSDDLLERKALRPYPQSSSHRPYNGSYPLFASGIIKEWGFTLA